MLPCIWVIYLADSNNAGIDKVFYYAKMTTISIIKLSYDNNNKELLPVSGSSSQNVCISSYSYTEEEENIGTDDPESIDSDTLESLSFPVCNLCQKRQLHINTDFTVTGWTLCFIPHIRKDEKYH